MGVVAEGWTVIGTAERLGVSRVALSRVLNGHAGVSAALALERIGWSDAEHWMRMQAIYDLAQERRKRAERPPNCMRGSKHPPIDWDALFPVVVLHLFGEPERRMDMIWCYGSKGSLVVHVGHNTRYDHKAGVGGDPLDLLKRVLKGDEANALRWLKDKGLIDNHRHDREDPVGSPSSLVAVAVS